MMKLKISGLVLCTYLKYLLVYLTQKALESATLHVNAKAPGIQGTALEALVTQFRHVGDLITRMSLVYPIELLEALVYISSLDSEYVALIFNYQNMPSYL